MDFVIYPAIDIVNGKCVRLHQGNYDLEKIYNEDPVSQALHFASEGARWIHVVDLDAARTGNPENREIISRIASSTPIPIQVGGGIRSVDSAKALYDSGVERVVIGTAAVENPTLIEGLTRRGHRVAVGLDGRNGRVATRGWKDDTELRVTEMAKQFNDSGVDAVIVTEIERDGTLLGPDTEGLKEVLDSTSLDVIASGGVGSLDDIKALFGLESDDRKLGGVIIGKSLYENKVNLISALNALPPNKPNQRKNEDS